MIQIRTAVLHNGVDGSVAYANSLKEQLTNECVVVNAFTDAPLKEALPIRAIPNVMVCLFCEGLEEYQDVVDIVNQLTYITRQPENEAAMHTAGAMLTDEQAVTVIDLYDEWSGKSVQVYDGTDGEHPQTRVQRLGDLYKCTLTHTTQEDWPPELTPNMWVRIDVAHAGTIDDPIPAARGMEYEKDKYYLDPEDGKTYLCTRGEVLQYLPHELVGHYFEVTE